MKLYWIWFNIPILRRFWRGLTSIAHTLPFASGVAAVQVYNDEGLEIINRALRIPDDAIQT